MLLQPPKPPQPRFFFNTIPMITTNRMETEFHCSNVCPPPTPHSEHFHKISESIENSLCFLLLCQIDSVMPSQHSDEKMTCFGLPQPSRDNRNYFGGESSDSIMRRNLIQGWMGSIHHTRIHPILTTLGRHSFPYISQCTDRSAIVNQFTNQLAYKVHFHLEERGP